MKTHLVFASATLALATVLFSMPVRASTPQSAPQAAAQDAADAQTKKPAGSIQTMERGGMAGMTGMTATPAARREMAKMMREMADCLDTGTDFAECHRKVHEGRNFRISIENERAGTVERSNVREAEKNR